MPKVLHWCYTRHDPFPYDLMPTRKKRINITTPDKLYLVIEQLAEQDDVPVSTKALQLLGQAAAMEELEDEYFSKLGDTLAVKNVGFISHEKFWDAVHKLQD